MPGSPGTVVLEYTHTDGGQGRPQSTHSRPHSQPQEGTAQTLETGQLAITSYPQEQNKLSHAHGLFVRQHQKVAGNITQ